MLGAVKIGDDCIVAGQSVVTRDLPNGTLAKGVPAKLYPDKGREAIDSWTAGNRRNTGLI